MKEPEDDYNLTEVFNWYEGEWDKINPKQPFGKSPWVAVVELRLV